MEGGGANKVLPLQERGRAETSFSCAEERGHNKFEVVLTWELEVLATVMGGGARKISTL